MQRSERNECAQCRLDGVVDDDGIAKIAATMDESMSDDIGIR